MKVYYKDKSGSEQIMDVKNNDLVWYVNTESLTVEVGAANNYHDEDGLGGFCSVVSTNGCYETTVLYPDKETALYALNAHIKNKINTAIEKYKYELARCEEAKTRVEKELYKEELCLN